MDRPLQAPKNSINGKLKAKVKELNSSSDIYATPGDTGVQQSLKAKLTERVMQLLEEAPQMLLSGLHLSHVVPLKRVD